MTRGSSGALLFCLTFCLPPMALAQNQDTGQSTTSAEQPPRITPEQYRAAHAALSDPRQRLDPQHPLAGDVKKFQEALRSGDSDKLKEVAKKLNLSEEQVKKLQETQQNQVPPPPAQVQAIDPPPRRGGQPEVTPRQAAALLGEDHVDPQHTPTTMVQAGQWRPSHPPGGEALPDRAGAGPTAPGPVPAARGRHAASTGEPREDPVYEARVPNVLPGPAAPPKSPSAPKSVQGTPDKPQPGQNIIDQVAKELGFDNKTIEGIRADARKQGETLPPNAAARSALLDYLSKNISSITDERLQGLPKDLLTSLAERQLGRLGREQSGELRGLLDVLREHRADDPGYSKLAASLIRDFSALKGLSPEGQGRHLEQMRGRYEPLYSKLAAESAAVIAQDWAKHGVKLDPNQLQAAAAELYRKGGNWLSSEGVQAGVRDLALTSLASQVPKLSQEQLNRIPEQLLDQALDQKLLSMGLDADARAALKKNLMSLGAAAAAASGLEDNFVNRGEIWHKTLAEALRYAEQGDLSRIGEAKKELLRPLAEKQAARAVKEFEKRHGVALQKGVVEEKALEALARHDSPDADSVKKAAEEAVLTELGRSIGTGALNRGQLEKVSRDPNLMGEAYRRYADSLPKEAREALSNLWFSKANLGYGKPGSPEPSWGAREQRPRERASGSFENVDKAEKDPEFWKGLLRQAAALDRYNAQGELGKGIAELAKEHAGFMRKHAELAAGDFLKKFEKTGIRFDKGELLRKAMADPLDIADHYSLRARIEGAARETLAEDIAGGRVSVEGLKKLAASAPEELYRTAQLLARELPEGTAAESRAAAEFRGALEDFKRAAMNPGRGAVGEHGISPVDSTSRDYTARLVKNLGDLVAAQREGKLDGEAMSRVREEHLGVLRERLQALAKTTGINLDVDKLVEKARAGSIKEGDLLGVHKSILQAVGDEALKSASGLSREQLSKLPAEVLDQMLQDQLAKLPENLRGPFKKFLTEMAGAEGWAGTGELGWAAGSHGSNQVRSGAPPWSDYGRRMEEPWPQRQREQVAEFIKDAQELNRRAAAGEGPQAMADLDKKYSFLADQQGGPTPRQLEALRAAGVTTPMLNKAAEFYKYIQTRYGMSTRGIYDAPAGKECAATVNKLLAEFSGKNPHFGASQTLLGAENKTGRENLLATLRTSGVAVEVPAWQAVPGAIAIGPEHAAIVTEDGLASARSQGGYFDQNFIGRQAMGRETRYFILR